MGSHGLCAELVLAADQFVIEPATRTADSTRARAAGEEARSVIAGYHWFTDWGRDTMISLEGLTLCTGRHAEARGMLMTFAHHLRDGLIPNLFPEGDQEGLYNTADATLWFFHAIDRYVTITQDVETLRDLLPSLDEVVRLHLAGTRFGIRVDDDGLLTQGAANLALTWMDAKVGDWVVTPRRGKTVEINALWYNAVRLLAHWCRAFDRDAARPGRGGASARERRSTAGSGSTRASTSTTSSMGRRATIRPCGRTRSSRWRFAIRCSTRAAGSGSSMSSQSVC